MATNTFLNPEKVIEALSLQSGAVVADFGAGSGYWTIPAAKKVGPTGKVYAIDILEEPLEVIRSRARLAGLGNIEVIRSDLEKPNGSTLKAESCDVVLISNILFQLKLPESVFKEATRILKPGKLLIVIEWQEKKLPPGPHLKFLGQNEIKNLASRHGFVFANNLEVGTMHFGLVFHRAHNLDKGLKNAPSHKA